LPAGYQEFSEPRGSFLLVIALQAVKAWRAFFICSLKKIGLLAGWCGTTALKIHIERRWNCMKTGIIVYVTGDDTSMNHDDQAHMIKNVMKADQVEMISRHYGYYDINEAWWALTAKGVHRVICVLAKCSGIGNLQLTGQTLQLCG